MNEFEKQALETKNQQVIKMYNAGQSMANIGMIFGISRQRVHQIINANPGEVVYKKGLLLKALKEKYNNQCNKCGKDADHWKLHAYLVGEKADNINDYALLCKQCINEL